jgi:hypothetical protein
MGPKKQKLGESDVHIILRLGAESLSNGTVCLDASESAKNPSQVITKVTVEYSEIQLAFFILIRKSAESNSTSMTFIASIYPLLLGLIFPRNRL